MSNIAPILRTDYKLVDKREGIHSVYGWLRGDTSKVPIIADGDKPFGILNERNLMSRRLDHQAKVEAYTLATRALPTTATLAEATRRLAEFRAAHLPVEDKGKLAGYVSAIDVMRESGEDRRAADLALPVATLTITQTLGEALHLFAREYVDVLPVTGKEGRIEGVLRRRTLVNLGSNISDRGRKDAGGNMIHMLKDVVDGWLDMPRHLDADAPMEDVLEALEQEGHALVRHKDGRVLGLITPENLMRSAGK